jgi:cytochrome c553
LIDIKVRRVLSATLSGASNKRMPAMGLMRKLGHSADLVNGMSQRLGVDQAARMARDPEREARRQMQMVTRCAGCHEQVACGALQAENDHLSACPSYCENKASFEIPETQV